MCVSKRCLVFCLPQHPIRYLWVFSDPQMCSQIVLVVISSAETHTTPANTKALDGGGGMERNLFLSYFLPLSPLFKEKNSQKWTEW